VRHPQVFLVVTSRSLDQEVRASVLFLDLGGKDGVPACSDGQAIGGTCQVTCVRRKDSERHAVLLHENLGACMHVNGLVFSFWLVYCGPYVHGLESFFVKGKARTYCFDGNRDGVEVAHRIA
jgi:hypothetical protein